MFISPITFIYLNYGDYKVIFITKYKNIKEKIILTLKKSNFCMSLMDIVNIISNFFNFKLSFH